MANKFKKHLLVLPEDDANQQIANGFYLEVSQPRNMDILKPAGGWAKVRDYLDETQVSKLRQYPNRYMILLMDFDDNVARRHDVTSQIPSDIRSRVYLLGVKSNPERLRSELGASFEEIGRKLASECRNEQHNLWRHEQIVDNTEEINELIGQIRDFLF